MIEGREEDRSEAATPFIATGYFCRAFGIVNANLAVDYTSSDSAGILAALLIPTTAAVSFGQTEDCTWHMWRNALMEARPRCSSPGKCEVPPVLRSRPST